MAHNLLSMYFRLQCTTLPYYSTSLFVNTEVAVNTCTHRDLFTVITTKDQSGGIYEMVTAQVARDLWLIAHKPRPWAAPLGSVCILP